MMRPLKTYIELRSSEKLEKVFSSEPEERHQSSKGTNFKNIPINLTHNQ